MPSKKSIEIRALALARNSLIMLNKAQFVIPKFTGLYQNTVVNVRTKNAKVYYKPLIFKKVKRKVSQCKE